MGSKTKRLITYLTIAIILLFATFITPVQVRTEGRGSLSFDTKVTLCINCAEVLAATESLAPTGQVTWTNLDDSYLAVDDDPDSPDTEWGDAISNNADTIAHVSFNTPSGNLNTGAGLQEFKIWVKKWDGTGTPTVQIDLYENGVVVLAGVLATTDVTSTTGELFSGTWDASLLSNIDGSGVEAYVHGKKSGGAPAARATVSVGAVEWNVDYSSCTPDISNTPTTKNFGAVANGTSYWSNGSAPTFPLDDGECLFEVTNNSGGIIDITIEAANFTGGVGWTLGEPAENVAKLKAGKSGDSLETNMVTLTNSPQAFIGSLADTASKKWELKLETPTSFTDGAEKSSTVTLTASCQ